MLPAFREELLGLESSLGNAIANHQQQGIAEIKTSQKDLRADVKGFVPKRTAAESESNSISVDSQCQISSSISISTDRQQSNAITADAVDQLNMDYS